MPSLHLKRTQSTDKATIGELLVLDTFGDPLWKGFSMELPWKMNREGVSSIPPGTYPLRWTVSPRFTREAQMKDPKAGNVSTFEVCNVPKRAGIRLHAANFAAQLKGCIAPGLALADLNGDGTLDVTSSRNALAEVERLLGKDNTTITIV